MIVKTWQGRIQRAKQLGMFIEEDKSVKGPEHELKLSWDKGMFSIAFEMGFAWQGAFNSNSIEACEYIYSQMVKIKLEKSTDKQKQLVTETWDKINKAISPRRLPYE